MKKLLCVLLSVLLILACLPGGAEVDYDLQAVPEITLREGDAEFRVMRILPVELGWDTVFRDESLHVYALLPEDAGKVVAVLLTDGVRFVHADMEQIGYAALYLRFDTTPLRLFKSRATWLVFIGTDGAEGDVSNEADN